MNTIPIIILLVILPFLMSFTIHDAAATDFVISNDESGRSTCVAIHGNWDDSNGTAICTINTDVLLNRNDSLTIESDTTLVNMANMSDSAPIINMGTIINEGRFIVAGASTETDQGGTLTNFGTIKNEKDFSSTGAFGAVSNEDTGIITNEGVFKIDNFLDNSGGVILNQQESVLTNQGIIKIDGGTFDNEGTFTNTGLLTLPSEISNSILLNNTSTVTVSTDTVLSPDAVLFIGPGTVLSINAGVSLTNSGNITNTNLISNFGTIDNKNILKNVGTLKDNCGSNFTNTSTLKGNAPLPECPSTISLTPITSPVPSNSPLKFTALVADANGSNTMPTGSVTFDDSNAGGIFGSTACYTQNNGSLVCNVTYTTPSTPKTITIAANYGGDFVLKPKLAQTSLTIKYSTTETIAASANPSVSGQYVVFTSKVSPPTSTGTVQFQVDGTDVGTPVVLSGGQASWSTSSLSVGLHVVTAVYSGDSNSFGVTAIASQTINQDNVVTMISSSQNPSTSGQQVTLTTVVNAQYPGSGIPTGNVVFYDNEAAIGTEPLVGNSASLSTALSGGIHIVTAVYSGDSNFVAGRSAELMQSVSLATKVLLSSSQNPSPLNQQVELIATVSPSSQSSSVPTGSVQFAIDGSNFGSPVTLSGTTALLDTNLSGGVHTITAAYLGDPNFIGSTSSPLMQSVSQPSTITITSSQNPSIFGQKISFTTTVSASSQGLGTPTGTVTFYDDAIIIGTSTLSHGLANYDISSLSAGSHAISVKYQSDNGFASSISNFITQLVNPNPLLPQNSSMSQEPPITSKNSSSTHQSSSKSREHNSIDSSAFWHEYIDPKLPLSDPAHSTDGSFSNDKNSEHTVNEAEHAKGQKNDLKQYKQQDQSQNNQEQSVIQQQTQVQQDQTVQESAQYQVQQVQQQYEKPHENNHQQQEQQQQKQQQQEQQQQKQQQQEQQQQKQQSKNDSGGSSHGQQGQSHGNEKG